MFKQSIKRSLFAIEKIRKFNPQVQLFLRYSQPASLSNVHKLDSQPANLDSVSVKLIKNTLEKNGCSFEDGFTCISTQCTNCHKEKCGSIFINKVTGFFICLECQEYGSWENIATKIKIQTKENESSDDDVKKKKHKKVNIVHEGAAEWEAITMRCKSVSTLTAEELQNVFSSFHLNARNLEILKKLDAYIDESRKNLYFPLISKKKIVGVKTLFKNNKEQCFPPKQCMGILKYISNLCKRKCDSAILVLSIRDTIAVCNMNPNVHVIHLPYGTVSLPQEILPLLEPYKKLILWFGNDLISLNAARTFSKKLGEQRCFLIRKINHSPSELIEHSEHVDISQIIKSAQPVVHKSIVTFSNLREDIWSELTNIDKAQGVKWKRFPALNEYVRGHRRGELTILTGPTGCGKTTFLSEYSLDLVLQGVSTLWGSFEIRNQRLALTMLQQMVQCPIHENLENFNSWADEFERLPLYFLKFHGPQPIKEVMEVIEHATYVNDIQHLVIDNLQFMMGLSANQDKFIDRFYKQDLVIAEFRTFATLRNCHVTLIIHPRKEKETDELNISSIFGGAKATQEADNIFIIQKKTLPSLHIKKYLQIVKNRYTGELGIVPLSFNKSSLSFAGKHPKEK